MSGLPPVVAFPNSKHPKQPRAMPPSENEIKNPKLKIEISQFQKYQPADAWEAALVSLGSNTHVGDRFIDKEVIGTLFDANDGAYFDWIEITKEESLWSTLKEIPQSVLVDGTDDDLYEWIIGDKRFPKVAHDIMIHIMKTGKSVVVVDEDGRRSHVLCAICTQVLNQIRNPNGSRRLNVLHCPIDQQTLDRRMTQLRENDNDENIAFLELANVAWNWIVSRGEKELWPAVDTKTTFIDFQKHVFDQSDACNDTRIDLYNTLACLDFSMFPGIVFSHSKAPPSVRDAADAPPPPLAVVLPDAPSMPPTTPAPTT